MTLLTLDNLRQSFGAFDVFYNVSARLPHGGRVGLVGANGVGKTSLLLITAGLADATGGSVHLARGTRVGYLRQEAMQAFGEQPGTLYAEMLRVFDSVHGMEAELRALETRLADDPAALAQYGDLLEAFEAAGGYDYELRIRQTLAGLGFDPAHDDLPLAHLSGGQKTRALLARLLLERPDLLILDEPTNHLDIHALRWLETTLRNWQGALLVVSHDRYFLDTVVDTVWELRRDGLDEYRGNYSAYVRQREQRRDHAEKAFQQERERLAGELEYIKRNIARASTNGMAVGRLRRLSRDLYAIEQVGLLHYIDRTNWMALNLPSPRMYTVQEAEQALKALENPVQRAPRLNLTLRSAGASGAVVLRTRDLCVGYPGKPLFLADDILLERGACAALIGGNGTGKTTFLRTLLGELPPLDGTLRLGSGVKIGYFAQAHNTLHSANTVLDELLRHKRMPVSEARSLLARYLFREDDVFKQVGMLSGGERAKLALAMLTLDGANLLLLDEPTNHLDIPAQEALQAVLDAYEGTILLVTHDRYLVDRLATQIWSLHAGQLSVYNGTYRALLASEHIAGEHTARQRVRAS